MPLIDPRVTYDEPVKATLRVRLANGREWDATDEDLRRFGLDSRLNCYMRFDDTLRKVLHDAGLLDDREEVTESALNAVRYLAEITINHPDLIDRADWRDVAAAETALRTAWGGVRPPEDESVKVSG